MKKPPGSRTESAGDRHSCTAKSSFDRTTLFILQKQKRIANPSQRSKRGSTTNREAAGRSGIPKSSSSKSSPKSEPHTHRKEECTTGKWWWWWWWCWQLVRVGCTNRCRNLCARAVSRANRQSPYDQRTAGSIRRHKRRLLFPRHHHITASHHSITSPPHHHTTTPTHHHTTTPPHHRLQSERHLI